MINAFENPIGESRLNEVDNAVPMLDDGYGKGLE